MNSLYGFTDLGKKNRGSFLTKSSVGRICRLSSPGKPGVKYTYHSVFLECCREVGFSDGLLFFPGQQLVPLLFIIRKKIRKPSGEFKMFKRLFLNESNIDTWINLKNTPYWEILQCMYLLYGWLLCVYIASLATFSAGLCQKHCQQFYELGKIGNNFGLYISYPL